jgi:hypothetical protein
LESNHPFSGAERIVARSDDRRGVRTDGPAAGERRHARPFLGRDGDGRATGRSCYGDADDCESATEMTRHADRVRYFD